MNRSYGKLVAGEVEYAPARIAMDDGTVVMRPSAETYLAAGWKRVVDEPPVPEPGCAVRVSGWEETDDSLVRVYKQVAGGEDAGKPRVFSKLKLVTALKEADRWVLVKTWIEERGLWDYYLAAQNFREDNELFASALEAVKAYARISDAEAGEILSKCILEED